MRQSGGNLAKYTGSWARKSARASRRACCTASCSECGLIGNISDKLCSDASISAMSRRNLVARLRPATSTNAEIATLIKTASADGAGSRSSALACGFNATNPPATVPERLRHSRKVNSKRKYLVIRYVGKATECLPGPSTLTISGVSRVERSA